jgi:DNA-binding MarR family transcriptional regulator
MEIAPLVMRSIRAEMRGHRRGDLSVPQFRTLIYLSRYPGASLSAVAEHLGLSLPTASRLVDGLVSRSEVERGASLADRRRVALSVTESGSNALETARRATQASLTDRLNVLSPAERASLAQALEALRRAFAPEAEPAPSAGAGRGGDA